MRTAWKPYLERNVPRYTSYPSALQFSEAVGPADLTRRLRGVGQYEPVSLYVHIPFCKQLCWYCGCNMRVENRYERIATYVDDLLGELSLLGAQLAGHGRLTQVHFGGGTPNTLSARDVERILNAIEQAFGLTDDTPIAMEIDPRLCADFQAAKLARLGVTRFSIGVQDFSDNVQRAINRVQPYAMVEDCISQLRGAGIADISLDLLYGLPEQTLCGFLRTVEQAITLAPDRISLFGYAHMPTRLRHQRLIDEGTLPTRQMRTALAEGAAARLVAAGYRRIGFDHFALPASPIARAAARHSLNRNFQGYTEDQADIVLGAGVSAISSVHGLISQNTKSLIAYRDMVAAGDLPVARGVIATLEEEDLGDWLKRLLCDLRASLSRYFEITGADGAGCNAVLARLGPLIADGLVRIDDDEIVIAEEAAPLARVVASVFDPYVEDTKAFASPAV
jgi:oxygen-independent coproporphyrinogen-3 oxidase